MADNKPVKEFYDIDVWKKSHSLVIDIYEITKVFPDTEKYGLVSQIKRAVASITANIAEGFGRYHYNNKINFYYNARGSASEVQNFLLIDRDIGYIGNNEVKRLITDLNEIKRMINGLVRSITNQK